MVRAHGWDRNLSNEVQDKLRQKFKINKFYSKYAFYYLAYNMRPTEINGFLGRWQIKYLDEIVQKRCDNFLEIDKVASLNTDLEPVGYKHLDIFSAFSIPIVCKTAKIKERLMSSIGDRIEIRPIVGGNIVRQPFFKEFNNKKIISIVENKSNADFIHERGFYISNDAELTADEVNEIKRALQKLRT
jgi:CDP-6-deoxy-D-xylo-4-hexulose-3-dehydrase